jgi:hypothetical protein
VTGICRCGNSKHQIRGKFQGSKFKIQNEELTRFVFGRAAAEKTLLPVWNFGSLVLGISLGFGAWDLVLSPRHIAATPYTQL